MNNGDIVTTASSAGISASLLYNSRILRVCVYVAFFAPFSQTVLDYDLTLICPLTETTLRHFQCNGLVSAQARK